MITVASLDPGQPRRPPILPPIEYLERNRVMSSKYSATGGNWSRLKQPYADRVFAFWTDPKTKRLRLCWASQVGKTTIMENCLMLSHARTPKPGMWVYPDDKLQKSFVKQRLRPTIMDCPAFRAMLEPGKKAITNNGISFAKAPLYFALAASEADLSSRPCGEIYGDEIDKFPEETEKEGAPLDQAAARMKTFDDARALESSTPTTPTGAIWAARDESDCYEWAVRDPKSGELVAWDFDRLRFEEKPKSVNWNTWAIRTDRGEVRVWYEFPSGATIETFAERCALNLAGEWLQTSEGRPGYIWMHLNSMGSMWQSTSFRELAIKFMRAMHDLEAGKHHKLKTFTQHEKSLPYEEKAAEIEEQLLLSRTTEHPRGVIPKGITKIALGIDVQHNGVYVKLYGLNPVERCSHECDFFFVEGNIEAGDLENILPALCVRTWKTEDGHSLRPNAALVDSGDGTLTETIYRACNMCAPIAWPAKGVYAVETHGAAIRQTTDKFGSHLGRLILVNVNAVKNWFYLRVQHKRMTFNAGAREDADWLDHMTSEERVSRKESKTGKARPGQYLWDLKPGRYANHYLDATVLALAALHPSFMHSEAAAAARAGSAIARGEKPDESKVTPPTVQQPPHQPERTDPYGRGFNRRGRR